MWCLVIIMACSLRVVELKFIRYVPCPLYYQLILFPMLISPFFYFLSIPALPSFDLHSTRPQNVRKAAEDEHEERIRQEEEDEEDKKHTEEERVISVVSHA